MLVLTRNLNQSIIIKTPNEKIEVKVLQIGNSNVRLGFNADLHVEINREEIEARKKRKIDRKIDGNSK